MVVQQWVMENPRFLENIFVPGGPAGSRDILGGMPPYQVVVARPVRLRRGRRSGIII